MYIDKFIFKDLLEKPPAEQAIEEAPSPEEPQEIIQEIIAADPIITKQELELSFQTGYEKAKAELLAQSQVQAQAQEQQIIEILNKINMQLALEIADQQKLFLELKQSAIELAIKAADKVIGEMTSANEEKIINFITKYINILEQELTVKIMLHPKTIALVGEKVEALIANNPLKFSMQADEHVKETDCLIKWHDGEVEYNTKSLWQRIQAAIAN